MRVALSKLADPSSLSAPVSLSLFMRLRIMRKVTLVILFSLSLSIAAQLPDDQRERARDGLRTYALPELDLTTYQRTGRWEAEVEVKPDGSVGAIHPLTEDESFPEKSIAKGTFLPLGGTKVLCRPA